MRVTLIALLLAGVAGCGYGPPFNTQRPVEEPKPDTENGGDEEPQPEADSAGDNEPTSDFEASLKAAEQGDAEAQNTLGAMYVLGEGVPEDATEAVKWYRKAAEQGDISAQTNLGVMYAEGKGVPQDYGEAYAWYSLYGQETTALRRVKAELTPEQLTAAAKRVEELTEQINANKAE